MNSFGRIFRITLFGESHGPELGVVIDGCPPGIKISNEEIIYDVNRRKAGKSGTTSRIEDDIPKILSGTYKNKTTGAPIAISFENKNYNSTFYDNVKKVPRPGHVDFVAEKRFSGFQDPRGGGHFSGRLTLPLVAAGAFAKKIIAPTVVKSALLRVGTDNNIEDAIREAKKRNDSLGAILETKVDKTEIALGEPFFDSFESQLSHLVFSVPGVKAIEFGAGFQASEMYGSEYNDVLVNKDGKTESNNSGGIVGGLTNGNQIEFKIAIRPAASIAKKQKTIDLEENKETEIEIQGSHDTCFALRLPVVVEAVTAIVIADFKMLYNSFTRISKADMRMS